MRVLAADAAKLHGLGGTLVLVDELHAHADDSVYTTLRTGVMKTPGSKMIVISTAGQGQLASPRPGAVGMQAGIGLLYVPALWYFGSWWGAALGVTIVLLLAYPLPHWGDE